jgi:lipopolysaccharide export system permease protein
LKSFIGPFVATFFITLFVLVMQFFWKYIDDLVGKGLDFFTLFKLTGYVTATAVPLALPLAVLISSIMTFGNLGESFELVAIKSSGIPLLRFMRPLFVVTAFISSLSFLFSNYIIPVANLKFTTLLYDIRVAKPAFDIKEGIFYDKLTGYAIKIGKKEKDGSSIHNIIIYENRYSLQDNIIIAERGKMSMSPDKKFLEFYLQDGWRYEERGPYNSTNTEYIRIGFKDYKKSFDLSGFEVFKTPDSAFKNSHQMLNIKQLQKGADSLKKMVTEGIVKRINREVMSYFQFGKLIDSGWKAAPSGGKIIAETYLETLPDSAKQIVYTRAQDKINLVKGAVEICEAEYKRNRGDLRGHLFEWHQKFSLPFACIVLFLIGAPLGSIIRKGGLGMPLVIAVIFFLIFHLLNMFGGKFVKEDLLTPLQGIWLSAAVLVPIGIFLTYKAMHDSQLFNQEFYFRFFRGLKNPFSRNNEASR